MTNPIPDAALDDRLGFVGTAGSGKTYCAGTCVERLLDRKARVVVVDPLGVWYGLRLIADGSSASRYSMPIFGGAHGDLPLNEHAGALIGETVAGMAESCIVALDGLQTKSAERRFMLAFLDAIYRKASGEPVHLIFDEADLWAPQKTSEPALQSLMEQICRRGRVKGLIPWLITQRPAVISKDVLSQVDGLVAFKLTSSQDRDALEGWIEGQADRAQWREIRAKLPTMQRGEGVVWLPAHNILQTAKFPAKRTFDSSRTPARGEKKRAAVLVPLNIDALKAKLSKVEEETKANDPKMLRQELAAALRRIAELGQRAGYADSHALAAKFEEGAIQGRAAAEAEAAPIWFRRGAEAAVREFGNIMKTFQLPAFLAKEFGQWKDIGAVPAMPRPAPAPPRPPSGAKAATPAANGGNGHERPLGAERKPLAALAAVYPAGMTDAQWRVSAGFKASGTWATYRSRLVGAGRVEQRGDLWHATDVGVADLGGNVPTMPEPGPALVEFWIDRIPAVGPILRRLAEVYPLSIHRDQLAADVNLTPTSGTYATYLSRLSGPELIEINKAAKTIRASSMLMEGIKL